MTSKFLGPAVESCRSQVFNGILLLLFFPEGEILLKELDDGFGISEGLLVNVVNLLEGVGESSLSKFAGLLVVVHNFVVEDGEVEGKSKSDWVAGVQALGAGLGVLIVLESTIFDGIKLASLGALGNVSVVISDHFVEESFGLISGGGLHAAFFDDINDSDALVVELLFNLFLVLSKSLVEF
jgi:hypothetical protein